MPPVQLVELGEAADELGARRVDLGAQDTDAVVDLLDALPLHVHGATLSNICTCINVSFNIFQSISDRRAPLQRGRYVRRVDVVDEMERAFAIATSVLREVRPTQWALPSPCEGWTVRDVVNHMVGGAKMVSVCLSGRGDGVNFYVDHLRGLDPVDVYVAEAAAAVVVFRVDPSLVDRMMPMPWGEATGAAVATMFMGDHFVHVWDVAKATGQSTDLDPQMAALVRRFAHEYVDVGQRRGPEMFDEERHAPAGATAADRLAAYLGRRV